MKEQKRKIEGEEEQKEKKGKKLSCFTSSVRMYVRKEEGMYVCIYVRIYLRMYEYHTRKERRKEEGKIAEGKQRRR